MKYVLVLGVVLFGIWLWRHNRATAARERSDTQRNTPQPNPRPRPPTDMVACNHCGLHLPLTDAVPGAQGHYCTDAHRRAREG